MRENVKPLENVKPVFLQHQNTINTVKALFYVKDVNYMFYVKDVKILNISTKNTGSA